MNAFLSNWADPMRSDLFSEQLHQLSTLIEAIKQEMSPDGPPEEISLDAPRKLTSKEIQGLLKARRKRETVFGPGLFADPAWDLLLEAYVAQLDQRKISVSGMCCAGGAPATTALRHLQKLEQQGWLVRRTDPYDGRRSWMELSAVGNAAMLAYFNSVSGLVLPI